VTTISTGSKAKLAFEIGIRDAEELLEHFKRMSARPPPPPEAEVLKRAGLIMAFTAWETYIEDRVTEELAARIEKEGGSEFTRFVRARLDEELKRFNNPNSEKTRKIFKEFLGIDVTTNWSWNEHDPEKVKETLDRMIAKRGEAVHRTQRSVAGGPPVPHLINKSELQGTIRFLKALVEATDKAL
jgi:hypothetical protein